MKRNLKFICISVIIYLAGCNSNIDFNNPQQISKNIQASKQGNIFINQYTIKNIKILEEGFIFPFSETWREKSWHLELDKSNNEIQKIDDSSSHQIVFKLNNKNPNFSTNSSFNWIMWDKYMHSNAHISGMSALTVPREFDDDTISLTIYKQKTINDLKNNLTPLAKFDLIKQQL